MYSELPVWIYILITLLLTQITIASVTIYLHRYQSHRALDLDPLISHFFRFWLWLTTGIVTKEWTAIHRKHHARVETEEDPHSPQVKGIMKVLLEGSELYRQEAKNQQTLENYGHLTPDDWLERNIYSRASYVGILLMLLINIFLFGFIGITIWAIQMIWIPFFAAGVINGLGHWWGYRNFEPADASTNIIPLGVFIGGEELHNNHHAFASSARFSSKWYELDLGWCYIRVLVACGLARVKKLAPIPVINQAKENMDLDSVRAIISNRFHVMSHFARDVISTVYKEEKSKANLATRKLFKRSKRLLTKHEILMSPHAKQRLNALLADSDALQVVYDFKVRLHAIWTETTANHENLLDSLQEWCQQAEASGISALEDFARTLRSYTLQPA